MIDAKLVETVGNLPALSLDFGLFGRLRRDTPEWSRYVRHPFLSALGKGTLPIADFRNFLVQDYLYIIQYARAYALSAYKSDDLEELKAAGRTMNALLNTEMPIHVSYCADWGMNEADMAATPPDYRMLAYTRYFLERGSAGDKLDLEVALAPCVVGYGEVAALLLADPETVLEGNPYAKWIEAYAGSEYLEVVERAIHALDALGRRRGADARYESLLKTFQTATALEVEFWGIGWSGQPKPAD